MAKTEASENITMSWFLAWRWRWFSRGVLKILAAFRASPAMRFFKERSNSIGPANQTSSRFMRRFMDVGVGWFIGAIFLFQPGVFISKQQDK